MSDSTLTASCSSVRNSQKGPSSDTLCAWLLTSGWGVRQPDEFHDPLRESCLSYFYSELSEGGYRTRVPARPGRRAELGRAGFEAKEPCVSIGCPNLTINRREPSPPDLMSPATQPLVPPSSARSLFHTPPRGWPAQLQGPRKADGKEKLPWPKPVPGTSCGCHWTDPPRPPFHRRAGPCEPIAMRTLPELDEFRARSKACRACVSGNS